MNAIQAMEKLRKLSEKADALARVNHYIRDDRDWADDVYALTDLQAEIERERDALADKLRTVQI